MSSNRMRQAILGGSFQPSSLASTATWPPIVYILLGTVLLGIWALGTSVQVLTSEAWLLGQEMSQINFNAFGQLWMAVRGELAGEMYVPFLFGWGVQLALIVASIGVELPPHPKWRYYLSWGTVITLIVVNACGDYFASSRYGFWGQCGFTAVVFFVTFCVLMFAIVCFKQAFSRM
ncbi:hypothetical protein EI42_05746 [Thermosporothrix hazakensis]|jgi:hypothetical protein|uniref:Uncharacterized protein n=1 Tax=Thermosporothrix hazakensis TaxID=644383 RepID=A0A326TVU0_THEHA|nr:hypothetical protein [Thermosporothrix hazakensis]PZW20985.1 hypothetical protein EI42_05746 [Thermosporothrix hazakensis]GCE49268.1 hypothetical protein KTH_41370 [Thermosporothrix hazakensis]